MKDIANIRTRAYLREVFSQIVAYLYQLYYRPNNKLIL